MDSFFKFAMINFRKILLDASLNTLNRSTCVFKLDLCITFSGGKKSTLILSHTLLILFECDSDVWHHEKPFNCKENDHTV